MHFAEVSWFLSSELGSKLQRHSLSSCMLALVQITCSRSGGIPSRVRTDAVLVVPPQCPQPRGIGEPRRLLARTTLQDSHEANCACGQRLAFRVAASAYIPASSSSSTRCLEAADCTSCRVINSGSFRKGYTSPEFSSLRIQPSLTSFRPYQPIRSGLAWPFAPLLLVRELVPCSG